MKKQQVIAIVIAVLMLISTYIGYKKYEPDKSEVFYSALEKVAGVKETATDTEYDRVLSDGTKVAHSIVVNKGNLVYVYMRFDDANKAVYFYDNYERSFDAAVQSMTYKGNFTRSEDAYVLFDGALSKGIILPEKTVPGSSTIYGGFYVKDDILISVYTVNGTEDSKQKVDDFLDKIDYKKPKR